MPRVPVDPVSTFSFETVRLVEERAMPVAVLNVVASVVVGVACCAGGWSLAAGLL